MGLRDLLSRLWQRASGQPGRDLNLPPADVGRTLADLASRTGLALDQLQSMPVSYRPFEIPKRHGGVRKILAPGDDLKSVQRQILHRVLKHLPVHPAASAFELRRSIVDNASPHVAQAVVIRMDIKNFFGSISARRVEAYFRHSGWNAEAAKTLTRLCTFEGALPQGAPTSPKLSNLVNQRLDARVSGLVAGKPAFLSPRWPELNPKEPMRFAPGVYTRYVDDITISFPYESTVRANWVIHAVKAILEDEGYELHTHKKLRIMRSHQQQRVTGLVVNAGVRLPRSTRRRLRAVEHHLDTGRPATLTAAQLAGWKAYQSMIERDTTQAP